MRRSALALAAILSISLLYLTSCGGGAATPPPAAPGVTLSASSLTFTNQNVGTTSASQAVTLTNSGNASLSITSIAATGDFAQSNNCGTSVAAGSNCTINVTFTPTATGSRTGNLTFTDDASGSPQAVTLTGTGTAPAASLSITSLTFASQAVGTTSGAQAVTLSNSGNATLTITSITVSGDFAQTNTCSGSVPAGANCAINVTFAPTATATRTGTLTITDNASDSPQTVSLSGTGAAATSQVISGTATKGAESGATVTVYAVNADGSNGTVLATGTTDASGNFSITLTPASVGPIRVVVSGGSYTGESSGSAATGTSDVSALVTNNSGDITGLSVTPLSELVNSLTIHDLGASGATAASAQAQAEAVVAAYVGLPSGTAVEFVIPQFTSSSVTSNPTGFSMGVLLGAIAQLGVNLNPTSPDDIIHAISLDISDGIFDGKVNGNSIPLGSGTLSITAATTDLLLALNTYVVSGAAITANGITSSQTNPVVQAISGGVSTSSLTPSAVGLAASSSGAVGSLAFSGNQYVFLAAQTAGVVAVNVTDPTHPVAKAWSSVITNVFSGVGVGGVVPLIGTASHPQVFVYDFSDHHIGLLNAQVLALGTPGNATDEAQLIDFQTDLPLTATSPVCFSGGCAFIAGAIPDTGRKGIWLATVDGYRFFDTATNTLSSTIYPIDPNEQMAENFGADIFHGLLVGGNYVGIQLIDLNAGQSYDLDSTFFNNNILPIGDGEAVDGDSVDSVLQVGTFTPEHVSSSFFFNMATITKTAPATAGQPGTFVPATTNGWVNVPLATSTGLDLSGSATDSTTHLVFFAGDFTSDVAVGQLQDPASVAAGATWNGLTDWVFCHVPSSANTALSTYTEGGDPHGLGLVYNLAAGKPFGYGIDGGNHLAIQVDMNGLLAMPRAGTSGDPAHLPAGDPGSSGVITPITW